MLRTTSRRLAFAFALAALAVPWWSASAQGTSPTPQPTAGELLERAVPTAPVVIDGVTIFQVRGSSAFPAGERAAAIAQRIRSLARDRSFEAESLGIREGEIGTELVAAGQRVMVVTEADAAQEGSTRLQVATLIADRVRSTIRSFREARSREALLAAGLQSLAATAIAALALLAARWFWRRLDAFAERRFKTHLHKLEQHSFQLVSAEGLWAALRGTLRVGRTLTVLMICFIYLELVLSRFPWTRPLALHLVDYVVAPLQAMGAALAAKVPDLVFLAILILVFRYLLGLLRLFFDAVGRGRITFENFEAAWAEPTYKITRLAVIAFGLVVAYPYIPGSGSAAFKGVSLFIGVVFSLGSSSAISNLIAGLLLTYRRAFRLGDRVRIGEVMGDVIETRLQVTHIRTAKNEEVVVPNSLILNSHVVNYSSLAASRGLILHTTVGIGYETPWRQVEAMLLIAAGRTPGLLADPPPFVLHKELGDFCVTYELNVYCDNPHAMMSLYTALHRNILDVFNEHGVQIMTPAYEGDPEQPKIVPREEWFTAPARRE
jgi:small-conductance mechanosensitive channel